MDAFKQFMMALIATDQEHIAQALDMKMYKDLSPDVYVDDMSFMRIMRPKKRITHKYENTESAADVITKMFDRAQKTKQIDTETISSATEITRTGNGL